MPVKHPQGVIAWVQLPGHGHVPVGEKSLTCSPLAGAWWCQGHP